MEATVRRVEARPGVALAEFAPPAHPGEIDFRRWLDDRIPPGAPTLEICPPGARSALYLPQVRPAVLAPSRRRGLRRRGAAPAVHAACMVDLEGLSHHQLARSAGSAYTTERSVRQHVRDGRFVAAELGLWPWAVVGGQPLQRRWWADERFAHALAVWAGARVPAA